MLSIEIKDEAGKSLLTTSLPETWNELSKPQLLEISKLFDQTGKLITQALDQLSLSFLGLEKWRFNRNRTLLDMNLVQFDEIASKLDWIFEEKASLTAQLIPKLKIGRRTYTGPDESIGNCTAAEISKADTAFLVFQEKQEECYLDDLIAILYRPRKWWWPFKALFPELHEGDLRRRFNDYTVKRRAKRMVKLPKEIKKAILIYYQGCKSEVVEEFPNAFDGKKSSNGLDFGMTGLLLSLSGDKFGEFEKTKDTNFWLLMMEVETLAVEQKKAEERRKKS